jgi:hypothetical protein
MKEALNGKDKEKWSKAIEEELRSHEKKQTWKLVELPEGKKAIDSKWVRFVCLLRHYSEISVNNFRNCREVPKGLMGFIIATGE